MCIDIYTILFTVHYSSYSSSAGLSGGGGGYGEGGTIVEGTKGDDFVGVIWGGGTLRPILGNFTIFTMWIW